MKHKAHMKWLAVFIFMVLLPVLFNIVIDSNGYFQFPKIARINANKYDIISEYATKLYYARVANPEAIMLGTSRMLVFNPSDIEFYIKKKTYNLSLSGSNIYEQLSYFQYMVTNYDIKYVILSLDFFAYNPDNKHNTGFDERRFDRGYLVNDIKDGLLGLQTVKSSIACLRDNINGKCPDVNWELGFSTWCEKEQALSKIGNTLILRDMKNSMHVFSTDTAAYNSKEFMNPDSISSNLSLLRRIVDTCKERNISLKLYVSPIYNRQFDLIYAMGLGNTYERWKYEIAQIADYYDFTGRNSVTSDKKFWWDTSHLRGIYGRYIFARVFGDNQTDVPDDFGIYMTKDNVRANIEKLHSQVKFDSMKQILRLTEDSEG